MNKSLPTLNALTEYAFKLAIILFFVLSSNKGQASEIVIYKGNAVVWLNKQTITGKLSGFSSRSVTVNHNGAVFTAKVNKDSSFSFVLSLRKRDNIINVTALDKATKIVSDTLVLTLGYTPLPVIKPFATLQQNKAILHASVISNSTNKPLTFFWTDDNRNPVRSNISKSRSSSAQVTIPLQKGVYYFNLRVVAGQDSALYQTFVSRTDSGLQAFDMETQYAGWIDSAIIYEITPSYFVKNGTYDDITNKLGDLKKLGVNTIWLQPVNKSWGTGQGYGITDYFSLRHDLGNELQLSRLIKTAKALQMHVLFDFVPNHTSVHHPYAQDGIKYGLSSHYYNFYQHEKDSVKYANLYNVDSNSYVYYFWKDLVNLNYNNEEVQQWMIEACKYWVKKFDIDGYRFDAVWGVNARAPLFAKRLRTELKSIKPDLLLLAEDKGADESAYHSGFDFAYDWTADTSWISQWSWQYEYDEKNSKTIFNFPDSAKRAFMLRKMLFQHNRNIHRTMHFIENNDLPRFITDHGVARTKMAAALLFSLPGIPLIYCGQEVGFQSKLYSNKPIFLASATIQSTDWDSLFSYYQKLIRLRTSYSALRDKNISEIPLTPANTIISFKRENKENIFIVIVNLADDSARAIIDLSTISKHSDTQKNRWFKDVLSGDFFYSDADNPLKIEIPMKGYGTRWLMVNALSPAVNH